MKLQGPLKSMLGNHAILFSLHSAGQSITKPVQMQRVGEKTTFQWEELQRIYRRFLPMTKAHTMGVG